MVRTKARNDVHLYRVYFLVKMEERISRNTADYARKLRLLNMSCVITIAIISGIYIFVFIGSQFDDLKDDLE